jgi:uncharacterized protein YaiL (DUF2058 family)
MSNSLKDQLVALGLAQDKPKKRPKPRGKPRPASDRPPRTAAAGKGSDISLDAAWRARDRDEKKAAEDKAAAKRAEDLRRRQVNAEIAALVKDQALNSPAAEVKRNFLYKGRIRTVLVTPEQLPLLNEGRFGVVFLRGSYLLVTPELAERVRVVSAEHVPDLGGEDAGEDEGDYPVPDDLVW